MLKLQIDSLIKLIKVIEGDNKDFKFYDISNLRPLCKPNFNACLVTKYDIKASVYKNYIYLIDITTLKVIHCLYIKTFDKELNKEYKYIHECDLYDGETYIEWNYIKLRDKSIKLLSTYTKNEIRLESDKNCNYYLKRYKKRKEPGYRKEYK